MLNHATTHSRDRCHHLKTTIIHTTKKLEKQIKKLICTEDISDDSLLGKWNAALFHVHLKKCWLVSNGLTKYNVILTDINANKVNDIDIIFKSTFYNQLIYDGIILDSKKAEEIIGDLIFRPTDNDRSATAFQNQRIQDFEWWKYDFDSLKEMPIREINNRMNTTPIHIGKSKKMSDYTTSVEEMKKTVFISNLSDHHYT